MYYPPLISLFGKRYLIVDTFVPGRPISQGSKTMYSKGGKSWFAESNAATLNKWRALLNLCCMKSYEEHLKEDSLRVSLEKSPTRNAFHLHVDFFFNTPAKKPEYFPLFLSDPDLDKLLRAVGDSLTKTDKHDGIWPDDAWVCSISGTKTYSDREGAGVKVWLGRR